MVRAFSASGVVSTMLLESLARPTLRVLAKRVGVHDRQLVRWRTARLAVDQADTLAERAGLHPTEV